MSSPFSAPGFFIRHSMTLTLAVNLFSGVESCSACTPPGYPSGKENPMRRLTLFLILIVLASGGCSRGLGPRNLAPDRTAYIEALGDSWREQLLFNIVKLRYGDALTFLDVSSITQTYSLDTNVNAGYDIGWGEGTTTSSVTAPPVGGPTTTSQRVQNLFPRNTFSAGINSTYRTYPTITFSPIAGEVIKETIFTPLSPIKIFEALRAGWQIDFIIPYCVGSINNVESIQKEQLQEMSQLVALWDKLDDYKAISYVFKEVPEAKEPKKDAGVKGNSDNKEEKTEDPKPKSTQQDKLADNLVKFTDNLVKKQKEEPNEKAAFIILDKGKAPKGMVEEFQRLLSLVDKKSGEYEVVSGIPPQKGNLDKIYVKSRSVFQILNTLAHFIHVPPSHENPPSGGTWVYPGTNGMKWYEIPHFQIRSEMGLMKPNEFAAVKYKGHWFYIPNGDTETKRVFSGLLGIFSMMKSAPSVNPILTIPVR